MSQSQIGISFAFVAALLWAAGPILASVIIREIGVMRFSRIRYLLATPIVSFIAFTAGDFSIVNGEMLLLVLISAVLGLIVAESCFFESIRIIGPRRSTLLQASNIVLIVLFAYLFLEESLTITSIIGILLCMIGIVLALLERNSSSPEFAIKNDSLYLWGVFLGFLAAVGQAGGILTLKAAMTSGIDIYVATFLRISFAAIATFILAMSVGRICEYRVRKGLIGMIFLSGLMSNILGTLALAAALTLASAAVVGTISALSPVLILPLVALLGNEKLTLRGIAGACVAFAGTALLMWKA